MVEILLRHSGPILSVGSEPIGEIELFSLNCLANKPYIFGNFVNDLWQLSKDLKSSV